MRIPHFFLVPCVALLFFGCTTITTTPYTPSEISYRQFPGVGQITSVTIGSTLIWKSRVVEYEALELSEGVTVRGSGAQFEILPGVFIANETDADWIYYQSTDPSKINFYALGVSTKNLKSEAREGIRKNRLTGEFEAYFLHKGTRNRLPIPAGARIEHTKVGKTNSPGFRKELLYNGRSGSTIRMLYREFKNDMARPAFSQDLLYDLDNDDVIGFQEVRIRIVEANNSSITYVVLQGFSN